MSGEPVGIVDTLKHESWSHIMWHLRAVQMGATPFIFLRLSLVICVMGDSCRPRVIDARMRSGARHVLSRVWPAVRDPEPVLRHQDGDWQELAGHLLCAQHCIRSVATVPQHQPSRAYKVQPRSQGTAHEVTLQPFDSAEELNYRGRPSHLTSREIPL